MKEGSEDKPKKKAKKKVVYPKGPDGKRLLPEAPEGTTMEDVFKKIFKQPDEK